LLAGDLRFDDVSLRYFPGGPLALRHVDFHVQSCEKVGCCQQCGSAVTAGSSAELTASAAAAVEATNTNGSSA